MKNMLNAIGKLIRAESYRRYREDVEAERKPKEQQEKKQ